MINDPLKPVKHGILGPGKVAPTEDPVYVPLYYHPGYPLYYHPGYTLPPACPLSVVRTGARPLRIVSYGSK